MKKIFFLLLLFIFSARIFFSCKKPGPWDYKAPNKPPTAIAGPNQVWKLEF